MVLSRAAVKQMAHSVSCRCPRADTADDMWIGACASYLNIAIIHVSGFHQVKKGPRNDGTNPVTESVNAFAGPAG